MERNIRIAVLVSEDEKRLIERNAALYASAHGIDNSTSEAIRHIFLNMDAIKLLQKPKRAPVAIGGK